MKLIILLILVILQGCNVETSQENLDNLPIYTQQDMDSVLAELEQYKNAYQVCIQTPEYTCPAQEECTPSYFGPEVCAYACTVEKYSCIYRCWEAVNGYKCTESCVDEYNACQSSC